MSWPESGKRSTGRGAQSLNEAREVARQEKKADALRLKDEEMKAITFSEFWDKEYFPSYQAEKKAAHDVFAQKFWGLPERIEKLPI